MLRPTMDTLPGDDLGASFPPSDPPHIGVFARRAPARSAGLTAPTAGPAAHSASTVAAPAPRTVAPLLAKATTLSPPRMPPAGRHHLALPAGRSPAPPHQ